MGKLTTCLFFAFRYISGIYISQKKAICLGSITKSHVTRYSGGLQSRAKNKAPFEKLRLADFSIMGQWSCLEFRFICVLGGQQTPKTVCKGGLDKVTPALQVVIVPYLLGSTRELGTV